MSDTHITGPQYVCCTENGANDNSSIQHSEERLNKTVDEINAIDPPPDLVVVTGDIMHNPYYSLDPQWYATTESAWTITPRILAKLKMPVYVAWGNHDYDVGCDGSQQTISRETTNGFFKDHYGVDPYYAVDHKGFRFLLGNSMLGPTWETGNAKCDHEFASYGAEQLAWIDSQLAEDLPTIFLSHYPAPQTAKVEQADARPDLMSVLAAHPNTVAHLAGHDHRYLEIQGYPYQHVMVGGTSYDADNFWLLELDPKDGTMTWLDAKKTVRFSDCSSTWKYDGTPTEEEPQPTEDGDCL